MQLSSSSEIVSAPAGAERPQGTLSGRESPPGSDEFAKLLGGRGEAGGARGLQPKGAPLSGPPHPERKSAGPRQEDERAQIDPAPGVVWMIAEPPAGGTDKPGDALPTSGVAPDRASLSDVQGSAGDSGHIVLADGSHRARPGPAGPASAGMPAGAAAHHGRIIGQPTSTGATPARTDAMPTGTMPAGRFIVGENGAGESGHTLGESANGSASTGQRLDRPSGIGSATAKEAEPGLSGIARIASDRGTERGRESALEAVRTVAPGTGGEVARAPAMDGLARESGSSLLSLATEAEGNDHGPPPAAHRAPPPALEVAALDPRSTRTGSPGGGTPLLAEGPAGAVPGAVAAPPASPVALQAAVAGPPVGGGDFARAVTAQVAGAIATEPASARIELRLDPPELGPVEISLEIADQTLRATVTAERLATHDLVRRHADLLLAQLQQAGFSGVDLRFAGEQQRGFGGGQPQAGGTAGNDGDVQPERRGSEGYDGRPVPARSEGLDLRF